MQPDVVIMDEMIGAGDQSFIQKAQKRIEDLLERTRILVLASHSMPIIRSFCNKVLWLEQGRIKMLGLVGDILPAYEGAAVQHAKVLRAS